MSVRDKGIYVRSEIGRLRAVLLHRPSGALDNLTPDLLSELLFEDIPFLEVARREHEAFAQLLRSQGVEVVYVEQLLAEALGAGTPVKSAFIQEVIRNSRKLLPEEEETLVGHLESLSVEQLITRVIAGIRKKDLPLLKEQGILSYYDEKQFPFYLNPLPNLLFVRDIFASVGTGVILGQMFKEARRRESLISRYIFNHHPHLSSTPLWYGSEFPYTIEGGDIILLNQETLAIGLSERTSASAVTTVARNLFKDERASVRTVLAIEIPKKRDFMHLDTIFTMIDRDKFAIHPDVIASVKVYTLTKDGESRFQEGTLREILSKFIGSPVEFIECGGGYFLDAQKEQWNDGTNTLAIAPGEVVCYDRNVITNEILTKKGVTVHTIPSSELSRGRGGPRCMSMPLIREDI